MVKRKDLPVGVSMLVVSIAATVLIQFFTPAGWAAAPGRMMPGHADMACDRCHKPAAGTVRQQVQTNVAFWTGLRDQGADFGKATVNGTVCRPCHERKADTHPTYRFNEPRFLDAVNLLDARDCLSCHAEHKSRRVLARADRCELCHARLKVKNDPLDTSHASLIARSEWESCLGCHDYHGNHRRKAQKTFTQRIARSAVDDYLARGPSPYGDEKREKAKQP